MHRLRLPIVQDVDRASEAFLGSFAVCIEWPTDLTLYRLFTDWGSLFGGVFALVAGVLLYCIGQKQVAAANRQTDFLKTQESRNLARKVITAGRILEGILKLVDDNISTTNSFGTSQTHVGQNTAIQIRQRVTTPPCYELIDELRHMGREIVDNYFLLCTRIADFKKQTGDATATSLHTELQVIRKTVAHIRFEIADESKGAMTNWGAVA